MTEQPTHKCQVCSFVGWVHSGICYCHGKPMVLILKELEKLKELLNKIDA